MPTMPFAPATKICKNKAETHSVLYICTHIVHFDNAIPAGCWKMLYICMSKS